jgi:hypothetical protein
MPSQLAAIGIFIAVFAMIVIVPIVLVSALVLPSI